MLNGYSMSSCLILAKMVNRELDLNKRECTARRIAEFAGSALIASIVDELSLAVEPGYPLFFIFIPIVVAN